jgi:L-asparaginase / beta-aspartyl-peptidase
MARTRMIAIAVHGGAGALSRRAQDPATQGAYRAGLERALSAGYEILAHGHSSLDAVEAAVLVLEDDPLFNAGRGAVFTADGSHELDAAIMDGATLGAGAVASVRYIRHPVALARRVMQHSGHVLMAGPGAEAFAAQQQLEFMAPEWFDTEQRRAEWLAHPRETEESGTVGAVALDRRGHLAAATSTGGTTGKRPGRVGDSPLIGVGTYANAGGAVSATGQGEYLIRATVAREVCARMEHLGESVAEAARCVIHGRLADIGGRGGLIAIDRAGAIALEFNTERMFRGVQTADGTREISI